MNRENAWRLFMKKTVLIMLVMLVLAFFAGSGGAQQINQAQMGKGYKSQVIYPGSYKSVLLFFRHTATDSWQRKPYMDRLRKVTCQDALYHLNSEGTWKGSLNPDGSCGTSSIESPEWATGNRLNYNQMAVTAGN
jgi:hypothetical protein